MTDREILDLLLSKLNTLEKAIADLKQGQERLEETQKHQLNKIFELAIQATQISEYTKPATAP